MTSRGSHDFELGSSVTFAVIQLSRSVKAGRDRRAQSTLRTTMLLG